MLAELAAANAAFAIIKETINNGNDLASMGETLGKYFGLKSDISKKANNKGKSSDEFWAAEQLKEQEEELKNIMIYQGRAGLWDDWLLFQAEARREREKSEKEKQKRLAKKKQMWYNLFVGLLIGITGVTGIGVIALIAWVVYRGST